MLVCVVVLFVLLVCGFVFFFAAAGCLCAEVVLGNSFFWSIAALIITIVAVLLPESLRS